MNSRTLQSLQARGDELHVPYSPWNSKGMEQLNVEVNIQCISHNAFHSTANGTVSAVAVPALFTGQYNSGSWQLQITILSHISEASEKRTYCTIKCTSLAWNVLSESPDSQQQRRSSLNATWGCWAKLNLWSENLARFQTRKIFHSDGAGVRKWRQDSSYHPANTSGLKHRLLGELPLTVTGPRFHPKS